MSNKTLWIVANWKSNKMMVEALDWVSTVGPALHSKENVKVAVCPIFTEVEEVKKAVQTGHYPILVGVQDLSPFDIGSYTGEIPASLVKEFADLAILGHSERRKNFNESDELIAQKIEQTLKSELLPLLCVQDENTPVPESCKVIAYEPVFAIGTGNPDTPQNANSVAGKLKEKHGAELEVLYGGSVTSENAKAFLEQENINGLLIGKASLDAEEFVKIVNLALEI